MVVTRHSLHKLPYVHNDDALYVMLTKGDFQYMYIIGHMTYPFYEYKSLSLNISKCSSETKTEIIDIISFVLD